MLYKGWTDTNATTSTIYNLASFLVDWQNGRHPKVRLSVVVATWTVDSPLSLPVPVPVPVPAPHLFVLASVEAVDLLALTGTLVLALAPRPPQGQACHQCQPHHCSAQLHHPDCQPGSGPSLNCVAAQNRRLKTRELVILCGPALSAAPHRRTGRGRN